MVDENVIPNTIFIDRATSVKKSIKHPRRSWAFQIFLEDENTLRDTDSTKETETTSRMLTDSMKKTGTTSPLLNDSLTETRFLPIRPQTYLRDENKEYDIDKLVGHILTSKKTFHQVRWYEYDTTDDILKRGATISRHFTKRYCRCKTGTKSSHSERRTRQIPI